MKIIKILTILLIISACSNYKNIKTPMIRSFADSIGFATKSWQMDSIIQRIQRFQDHELSKINSLTGDR